MVSCEVRSVILENCTFVVSSLYFGASLAMVIVIGDIDMECCGRENVVLFDGCRSGR